MQRRWINLAKNFWLLLLFHEMWIRSGVNSKSARTSKSLWRNKALFVRVVITVRTHTRARTKTALFAFSGNRSECIRVVLKSLLASRTICRPGRQSTALIQQLRSMRILLSNSKQRRRRVMNDSQEDQAIPKAEVALAVSLRRLLSFSSSCLHLLRLRQLNHRPRNP